MSARQDSERFADLGASLTALATEPAKVTTAPRRQRRVTTVHFRANEDEHVRLRAAAERMGLTVSSFVRLAVREKLGLA